MGMLDGKTALITGASRGIGAAVARRYAAEGAAVVVSHYPDEEMTRLAGALAGELVAAGHRAIAVPADVSDPEQVDDLVKEACEAFGGVDILVANAATFGRGAWIDIDVAEWDHIFAVNVRGAFLCAQAVFPSMLKRGGGSIITVSSVTAHLGFTDMLGYVSTKGAIIAFTRALAREVGPSEIRVNSVMPGAIRTEHEVEMGGDEQELAEKTAGWQCLPRRGYAEDLAGTFVYLASEQSSFVTGQVIPVDGGWVHR